MNSPKVAISIESSLLLRIDSLVERKIFRSRSEAFQVAVTKQTQIRA